MRAVAYPAEKTNWGAIGSVRNNTKQQNSNAGQETYDDCKV